MKRAALALFLVVGCAAHGPSARSTLFNELEARAEALKAREIAKPELALYREERARADALAIDAPERGEVESAARAYIEAAIAHAERNALAEQRLAIETQLVAREAELTRIDRERIALEHARGLERTRAIADAEIARAYARLDLHPAKRPKLSREELASLSKALLGRAQLIALALEDSELDASSRAEARSVVAAAKTARSSDDALAAADRALTRVQILLAKLRIERGPTDAERTVLAQTLSAEKFATSRAELGLAVQLGSAADGARQMAGLCRLGRAHPHGAVVLLTPEKTDAAKLTAAWKQAGCEPARLRVDSAAGRTDFALVFSAY